MADSEISINLPKTFHQRVNSIDTSIAQRSAVDPILTIWGEWKASHERRHAYCRKQQELETKVLCIAGGFPLLRLKLPEDRALVLQSFEQIEKIFEAPELANLRNFAKAELERLQNRWDHLAEHHGYTQAFAAEINAAEEETALAKNLVYTPAKTITGIAAKLHCIIGIHDAFCDESPAPWPELLELLEDLIRLGSADEFAPATCGCSMNHADETFSELIISSGNCAVDFNSSKKPFD
nr:hypothetical protein [[Ochrobactrum] quorumnocens]